MNRKEEDKVIKAKTHTECKGVFIIKVICIKDFDLLCHKRKIECFLVDSMLI